jgi:hypothetical protein
MGKVGNIYWMDSCRDQAGILEHNGALWWKQDEGVYWSLSSLSPPRRSQMQGEEGDVDDDEDDDDDDGTMVVKGSGSCGKPMSSLSPRADASSSLSDSDGATSFDGGGGRGGGIDSDNRQDRRNGRYARGPAMMEKKPTI